MRSPANDFFPQPTRGEPTPRPEPAGFDELDWPDEIELEIDGTAGAPVTPPVLAALFDRAGLSRDRVTACVGEKSNTLFVVTEQAEDVWYAGVLRSHTMTLRRIR